MMRYFYGFIGVLFLLVASLYVAHITSPDPTHNPASLEDEPLEAGLAPIDQAITLAQYETEAGAIGTLLVTDFDGQSVRGIALTALGAPLTTDPFEAFAAVDLENLSLPASGVFEMTVLSINDVLPSGPRGNRHIGIGTNFPEHAEESSSDGVFNFPKFGAATPARTRVSAPADGLLDYEVELCVRFDRPIRSLADFDAAVKGLFLCADFTDRIALVQLADPDNLDSGYGFSDAKSGEGFFPTGPFLVIPKDLAAFVKETRMTTTYNGAPRQVMARRARMRAVAR
ncbi:fumarylacetoacetate hydrolase family protein [Parvularcula sp. IMCC14364]|uniref:fumarylacetoacetate hydrolase family protein n=1 Tax=Parvularcula sp. IMCC14364 TaxID=3067902 RepID=UPI0027414129|nr:fumarylacetoacetate hydrolase family protein [Parvularcula sp. IMCC14364]